MSCRIVLQELRSDACGDKAITTGVVPGSSTGERPESDGGVTGNAAKPCLSDMVPAELATSVSEQIARLDEVTFPANVWGLESYRKSADNDYDYLITAFSEESGGRKLAGFALLRCFDDAELIRIAVAAEFRRQGIGTRLLKALIDETRRRDIHNVFLEVRSSNAPAIGLYEGAGFLRIGVRRNYYSAPAEDAVIMRYTW